MSAFARKKTPRVWRRWLTGSTRLGACALVAAAAAAQPLQTLQPGFAAPEHRLIDVDGDGRIDLVAISADGRVAVYRGRTGETPLDPEPAALTLPDPAQTLLEWADVLDRGAPQLIAL